VGLAFLSSDFDQQLYLLTFLPTTNKKGVILIKPQTLEECDRLIDRLIESIEKEQRVQPVRVPATKYGELDSFLPGTPGNSCVSPSPSFLDSESGFDLIQE
jgi:hypothetical protein